MTIQNALFLAGFPFIICGSIGLGIENKNSLELFLFFAEIMIGILLIYFYR